MQFGSAEAGKVCKLPEYANAFSRHRVAVSFNGGLSAGPSPLSSCPLSFFFVFFLDYVSWSHLMYNKLGLHFKKMEDHRDERFWIDGGHNYWFAIDFM